MIRSVPRTINGVTYDFEGAAPGQWHGLFYVTTGARMHQKRARKKLHRVHKGVTKQMTAARPIGIERRNTNRQTQSDLCQYNLVGLRLGLHLDLSLCVFVKCVSTNSGINLFGNERCVVCLEAARASTQASIGTA